MLERFSLRTADAVVVTTPGDKENLVRRYHVPQGKIKIIPNYVDTDLFRPMPEIQKETGLIVFVGRLEEQKNPWALLEAVKGVPGIRLLMIGEGTLQEPLKKKIQDERLPVEMQGVIPHAQLPAILNRAHLFILPSHFEGHPKVLLEAMSCGVPVIGADSPGIRELLVHRKNGCLAGPSSEALRRAILELVNDSDLCGRIGRQARMDVEKRYSLRQVIQQEQLLYAG